MRTTGTMGTTWGGDNGDNGGDHRDGDQPWGPHGDLLGARGTMWG